MSQRIALNRKDTELVASFASRIRVLPKPKLVRASSEQRSVRDALPRSLNLWAVISCMLALTGCGDGGSSGPGAAAKPGDAATRARTDTAPLVNMAPVISGTPPTTATVGRAYLFQPSASDANGDVLRFSISGMPSWALFDPRTGRLSGTPSVAGLSPKILITVSDGGATSVLSPFSITVEASGHGGLGNNRAPNISGTPPLAALAGQTYLFIPSAYDPDGGPLSFSVSGLPSWATFDSGSGRIRGTPSVADVGMSNKVSITVSDGQANTSLAAFTITVVATATGTATLSWQPPTQNDDGSPLADLAGYKVYWGQSHGSYTHSVTLTNPGVTRFVIESLTPGTWYFATTAFNRKNVESHYSNAASKIIL